MRLREVEEDKGWNAEGRFLPDGLPTGCVCTNKGGSNVSEGQGKSKSARLESGAGASSVVQHAAEAKPDLLGI